MGGCSVFGCNNSTRTKIPNSSFHKFPKRNSKLSKQWILFCKKKDPINIQSARICSLHFVKDDYINNIKFDMGFTAYRMLKPDAVPTIYLKGNFEFESTECSKEITAEQTEQNNLEISVSKQFDSEILIENEENECLSNVNASDPLSLDKTNQLYEEMYAIKATLVWRWQTIVLSTTSKGTRPMNYKLLSYLSFCNFYRKMLRAENEILNSKLTTAEKTIISLNRRIKELEIQPNNWETEE